MEEVIISKFVVGMLRTNCYVLHLKDRKEAIIFDPADNAKEIIAELQKDNLVLKGILLTHGHFDHIYASKELRNYYKTQIYAHKDEKYLLEHKDINGSVNVRRPIKLSPDVLLVENEELELAGLKMKVLHTPGHTEGSVCYLFKDQHFLISGDTLFYENVGAIHFPTGSGSKMDDSLNQILMKLEDDIVVYPGHGEETSIGYEREHNPFVKGNEGM